MPRNRRIESQYPALLAEPGFWQRRSAALLTAAAISCTGWDTQTGAFLVSTTKREFTDHKSIEKCIIQTVYYLLLSTARALPGAQHSRSGRLETLALRGCAWCTCRRRIQGDGNGNEVRLLEGMHILGKPQPHAGQ